MGLGVLVGVARAISPDARSGHPAAAHSEETLLRHPGRFSETVKGIHCMSEMGFTGVVDAEKTHINTIGFVVDWSQWLLFAGKNTFYACRGGLGQVVKSISRFGTICASCKGVPGGT